MSGQRVLFVDRDGTLIEEPADEQVDRIDKVRLVPGVMSALLRLKSAGYRFVLVSNQDGLGTESFPEADFRGPHEHMRALFASQGITFDEEFICPHFEADRCACRKPATGLLTRYLAANTLDLEHSAVIGDRETDVRLARAIGVPGLRLGEDGLDWDGIAHRLCTLPRRASVSRDTRETRITAEVDLDREGGHRIATGIGFFDHMLEQIATHGGFSLRLTCDGDLHVDEHHSVEDVALALGEAIREALGDKRGIGRFGFVLPMDEAQARIALDLSGRPYFVFRGTFPRERVGELPTEMVTHFFRSLADALRATLHIEVEGENAHHMVEICFKGLGRTLRPALSIEGDALPSSKGTL